MKKARKKKVPSKKVHVFVKHCVDFDTLLSEPDLDKMLRIAAKQSKDEEAKRRVDFANYKDYGTDQWCPAYFGMFGEWLCWHFLNHYGDRFNVQSVEMTDSTDSTQADYGIDGRGLTLKESDLAATGRTAEAGSPVYVQVKATLNKNKVYMANDGSRLPNFGMNAMSSAILEGKAYQGRYIVWTTGKGLYHTLDKMSNGMLEVITYKQIRKLMNRDSVFLNRLRTSVGLAPKPVNESSMDPEAVRIRSKGRL